MYEPRKMLNEFMNGIKQLGQSNGEVTNAFMGLLGAVYKPGVTTTKAKELVSIGIAVYSRCEYCIVYHVFKALESDASREEILESAMVGVAFGGGPAMAYSSTLLLACLDEFEPDFI